MIRFYLVAFFAAVCIQAADDIHTLRCSQKFEFGDPEYKEQRKGQLEAAWFAVNISEALTLKLIKRNCLYRGHAAFLLPIIFGSTPARRRQMIDLFEQEPEIIYGSEAGFADTKGGELKRRVAILYSQFYKTFTDDELNLNAKTLLQKPSLVALLRVHITREPLNPVYIDVALTGERTGYFATRTQFGARPFIPFKGEEHAVPFFTSEHTKELMGRGLHKQVEDNFKKLVKAKRACVSGIFLGLDDK